MTGNNPFLQRIYDKFPSNNKKSKVLKQEPYYSTVNRQALSTPYVRTLSFVDDSSIIQEDLLKAGPTTDYIIYTVPVSKVLHIKYMHLYKVSQGAGASGIAIIKLDTVTTSSVLRILSNIGSVSEGTFISCDFFLRAGQKLLIEIFNSADYRFSFTGYLLDYPFS